MDLFYIIGSLASGANISLVAKNRTKKIIPLLSIKSSKKPQIKKFHKTDPPQKWEFLFKIQFRNFQKPKIKLRKGPLKFQKSKTYIRRPKIKQFNETNPLKMEILFQNIII